MAHKPTRSQRARQTAIKSGHWQYGLNPKEVELAEQAIRTSHSRFVTKLGKLTVHKVMAGSQAVYCAYDSKISAIGFFIEEALGRRFLRRARDKRNRRPTQGARP